MKILSVSLPGRLMSSATPFRKAFRNMWRGRQESPEMVRTVISMAGKYNPARIYIEEAASGQSLIQSLDDFTRLSTVRVEVDTEKGVQGQLGTSAGGGWERAASGGCPVAG